MAVDIRRSEFMHIYTAAYRGTFTSTAAARGAAAICRARARRRGRAGMDELKRTKTATAPAMLPGTYVRAPSIERTEARRALCEAARPAAADATWLGGGGDAETLVRPCVGRLSMVAGTARACCLR